MGTARGHDTTACVASACMVPPTNATPGSEGTAATPAVSSQASTLATRPSHSTTSAPATKPDGKNPRPVDPTGRVADHAAGVHRAQAKSVPHGWVPLNVLETLTKKKPWTSLSFSNSV